MRGVVRDILQRTARDGAPVGDHHFYVTFRTKAPGVKIADHLIERFPQDMTIVIQHQYWDLEVHDTHFEIILKFAGVPQHLHIPFAALTRFVDPSVNFGVTFEGTSGVPGIIAPIAETESEPTTESAPELPKSGDDKASENTVVNLDAFRRK